jgi:hypothetical protein
MNEPPIPGRLFKARALCTRAAASVPAKVTPTASVVASYTTTTAAGASCNDVARSARNFVALKASPPGRNAAWPTTDDCGTLNPEPFSPSLASTAEEFVIESAATCSPLAFGPLNITVIAGGWLTVLTPTTMLAAVVPRSAARSAAKIVALNWLESDMSVPVRSPTLPPSGDFAKLPVVPPMSPKAIPMPTPSRLGPTLPARPEGETATTALDTFTPSTVHRIEVSSLLLTTRIVAFRVPGGIQSLTEKVIVTHDDSFGMATPPVAMIRSPFETMHRPTNNVGLPVTVRTS